MWWTDKADITRVVVVWATVIITTVFNYNNNSFLSRISCRIRGEAALRSVPVLPCFTMSFTAAELYSRGGDMQHVSCVRRHYGQLPEHWQHHQLVRE